ncbi:MAG: hypothetical protein IKO49_06710 [Bacilli bacterium]|nr:hypothetical protein [Bacilli bacterium]
MTRKEREEQTQENKNKKIIRVLKTLELFTQNNGNISDEELARLLAHFNIQSSSSTVGRDLTINIKKIFLEENKKAEVSVEHLMNDGLTNEQVSILAFIKQKRKDNKHRGQIKGGERSVFNNDVLREENSTKFNGSSSRHN